MRLVIERHIGSMRCERCLPGVIEMHRDCSHVLEQVEDGADTVTLIIRSDEGDKEYRLTPEQVELVKSEGWETILAEIDEFERNQLAES